jgi:hypothetical protein
MSNCGGGLFGPSSQFIKTNGGDLIATEGASTREKLMLSDLRIPYKQISKGRIILKPGQTDYPLNHLGLGNNATFLSLKVTYDPKSKFEFDNYIQWNYWDDFSKIYPVSNLLVLTGNSKKRIKQIYLHNPNPNYSVSIDAMIAVIDDDTSIFHDSINQAGLSFNNLRFTDIKTWKPGESLVIYSDENPPSALCFIPVDDLKKATLSKNGKIITISDPTILSIYLDFLDVENALQAYSILEWVKTTTIPNASIQEHLGDFGLNNGAIKDITPPVIYFTPEVYISGENPSTFTYSTSMGNTFSATMSLSGTYSTSGNISRLAVLERLIKNSTDNRDYSVKLDQNSILIYTDLDIDISTTGISLDGTYSVHFDVLDYAENSVSFDKNIQLKIIV